MRPRYGQGNGPGWVRRMQQNRRTRAAVAVVDERDVGVSMAAVARLGLDGERRSLVRVRCGCELTSREAAFRHLAWLRFKRDAVGELPFGVA